MNFHIQIDPIATLENQYKESFEKGTEPYPTLSDFDVNTPLEILEQYPVIPVLLTIQKIERQYDVSPFLKLHKPISNLPETEQKELIRYIRELAVDFVPIFGMVKDLTGPNAYKRTGPINNGIGFYLQSFGTALIKELKLGFTEKEIDACLKCRDPKCRPKNQPICSRCHHIISQCEREYINHYTGETTCNLCGERHAACLEHIRKNKAETCTPIPRKRSDVEESCEIITVETRLLLQRLKIEVRKIIKEIRQHLPTLVDFYTRSPDTFLERYPIIPATLTYLKEAKKNPSLLATGLHGDVSVNKKFIFATRDITAAAWGDTIADISATALIEHLNLPFSLADIDTCERCGDPACAGITGDYCDTERSEGGQLVLGCGEPLYACDTYHATTLTCDNPLCTQTKYRQCTEHTCEVKDYTDLVHYLFELENANKLSPNAQTFVKRINALTPDQQADFVKQFHATVAQMDPIEKIAAAIRTTLRKHGLKTTFENPEMK